MTNGEKFQQIFAVSQVDECDLNVYAWLPSHDAIEIPVEWWNANYSEIPTGSTTKNDLEVDCISRQAVIDLMMQKWGENFSGDDAMQESIDAIRVMPSVTPQEPRCKECKWWKDSDGEYRRGCGAESQCPINRREVFEGNGYCYLFEPQESEG